MPILTIDSARLNGTPSTGTVRIKASRSPLMDSGSNTVYSGTQTFPLDAQGKLSVSLPATDSPSLGAPFTYTVEANLASGQWIYRGVKLPANVATIDITDAQSASQKMYPTRQEWDAITAGKVNGQGMTLRHDTSVGERVFLDHPGGSVMLMGDTGVRDVSSLLANGWTAPSGVPLRLRRVGQTVTIAGRLDGSEATSNVFLTPPAGFGFTGGSYTLGGVLRGGDLVMRFGGTLETSLRLANLDIMHSWNATPTWPTTLPGTPS